MVSFCNCLTVWLCNFNTSSLNKRKTPVPGIKYHYYIGQSTKQFKNKRLLMLLNSSVHCYSSSLDLLTFCQINCFSIPSAARPALQCNLDLSFLVIKKIMLWTCYYNLSVAVLTIDLQLGTDCNIKHNSKSHKYCTEKC